MDLSGAIPARCHGTFSGCDSGEPQGARIERVTSGVGPHLLKLLAISRHRHAMAPLFWGECDSAGMGICIIFIYYIIIVMCYIYIVES